MVYAQNFFINLDGLSKSMTVRRSVGCGKRLFSAPPLWMLDHMKGSGGLGAIYPAMANSVDGVALSRLSESMILWCVKAMQEIEDLEVHDTVYVEWAMCRCDALTALPLSHMGHRTAHQCLVGSRHAAGSPRFAKGGDLAALATNEDGCRLDDFLSWRGAGRLVLSV